MVKVLYDYNATACEVVKAHTTIICSTVKAEAGKIGLSCSGKISVASRLSILAPEITLNFSAPTPLSFVGTGHMYLSTDGSDFIIIKGTNFGPAGSAVNNAMYKSKYSIFGNGNGPYYPSCLVLNNSYIKCGIKEGVSAICLDICN